VSKESIAITGLMLRRAGGESNPFATVVVEIEVDGKWFVVCTELIETNFSTIVGTTGMRNRIAAQEHKP
jgi:hypothetical protein